MGFDCSLLQDSRAVRFFDRKVSLLFSIGLDFGCLNSVHDSLISVLKKLILSLIYGKLLYALAGLLYSSW